MTESTDKSKIVYFTRLHWVIFFGPILALVVSIAVGSYVPQLSQLGMFLSVFSVFWLIISWATWHFSSITIQRKQVILRTGVIVRKTVDIPIDKIETIDIRQSIPGSILRYGTLIITGTGGTRHLINCLYKPLTCRRYIEQLMNDIPLQTTQTAVRDRH